MGPSNKGMKLTKLRAALERPDEVPPCARAARMNAGTASQLIPGVRWTNGRCSVLGCDYEDLPG